MAGDVEGVGENAMAETLAVGGSGNVMSGETGEDREDDGRDMVPSS